MTDFKEIELYYNRYFNFEKEIDKLIADEHYEEAIVKVEEKNKFMKKLARVRKTASGLSSSETEKLNEFDNNLNKKNKYYIELLKKLQDELGVDLKNIKQKFKIGNAYSIKTNDSNSIYVDTRE